MLAAAVPTSLDRDAGELLRINHAVERGDAATGDGEGDDTGSTSVSKSPSRAAEQQALTIISTVGR